MPEFRSIEEAVEWLEATIAETGFDMPIGETTLGEYATNLVVGTIQLMANQGYGYRDDHRHEWPFNDPEYSVRKGREYHERRVNFRTNQMLSAESLKGSVISTNDVIIMGYGTHEPPRASRSGYLSRADRRTTDFEKARWAHEQGRGFYEVGDEARERIHVVSAVAVADFIQRKADQ